MAAEMKRAGFIVEQGPAARRGTKGNIMGTKPA